jgi:hypothetical protein
MRAKNSGRPSDDLWSQPAATDESVSETRADAEVVPVEVSSEVLENEIKELVRPYQVRITERTLSKTVK